MALLQIDFLKNSSLLQTKNESGKCWLMDPIRKKYISNEPEELVRQLVIWYLHKDLGYSKNLMSIERTILVNKLCRRYDLLIFHKNHTPKMLVECKAPHVAINENTFRQIAYYNLPLQVPYLLVTNGLKTYCCSMDYENETYHFLEEIPGVEE
ncbi:MAG: type I restriction enzyme HsdR N-terminal domain-containing protein [Saprospiraceae bacterium]